MDYAKFNQGRKSTFDLPAKEYRFIEKNDKLNGVVYRLDGCYTQTSKFGRQSVFFCSNATEKIRVSLSNPDTVEKIIADTEMVSAIKKGNVAIEFYSYVSKKYNKTCWGCTFSDWLMY